jgi:hypothetical protein
MLKLPLAEPLFVLPVKDFSYHRFCLTSFFPFVSRPELVSRSNRDHAHIIVMHRNVRLSVMAITHLADNREINGFLSELIGFHLLEFEFLHAKTRF